MIRNELGHFEHGHLILAIEYRLQLVVGDDFALVGGVLQIVGLDVIPKLLGKLGARKWISSNNRC